MGQYKTNFSDTLRLFQVTGKSFHKTESHFTRKQWWERKYIFWWWWGGWLSLFIYFWDGARAGDWIYACPFVSVLVMIQMLHKDTAGRKSKFLKWQLLVPSNSHCFLDTFCCLYISKNIIPSAATSRHKRMFRKCSSLDVAKKNIYIISVGYTIDRRTMCSENVLFMSLKTSYHQRWLHSRHKENVQKMFPLCR